MWFNICLIYIYTIPVVIVFELVIYTNESDILHYQRLEQNNLLSKCPKFSHSGTPDFTSFGEFMILPIHYRYITKCVSLGTMLWINDWFICLVKPYILFIYIYICYTNMIYLYNLMYKCLVSNTILIYFNGFAIHHSPVY